MDFSWYDNVLTFFLFLEVDISPIDLHNNKSSPSSDDRPLTPWPWPASISSLKNYKNALQVRISEGIVCINSRYGSFRRTNKRLLAYSQVDRTKVTSQACPVVWSGIMLMLEIGCCLVMLLVVSVNKWFVLSNLIFEGPCSFSCNWIWMGSCFIINSLFTWIWKGPSWVLSTWLWKGTCSDLKLT